MSGEAVPKRMVMTGRGWLAALAIGFAVTGVGAGSCLAQCVELSERTPKLVLETFSNDPSSLLTQLRNSREKLRGRLTAYLVTDPTLLPAVRVLIRDAQTADRPAIGEALRLAELRCIATQPAASRKINEFVQKLGDLTVLAGYSSAAADEPTAPSPGVRSPGPSAGLMTGEWNTDLKDPFAPIPAPQ